MIYKEAIKAYRYDDANGRLVWNCRKPGVRPGMKAGFIFSGGYYVTHDRERVLAKNVVWLLKTGSWPKKRLYHRNGDRTDIRFENLTFAKPKRAVRNTVLSIEQDGRDYVVIHKGSEVGRSDDPEKIMAAVRALLVY